VTDYETIQRNRNITVGVFVLLAVAALIWLIAKFGDLPVTFSKWKSYEIYVQFASAPGVQKETPVRFCGYHVGRVTEIASPEILEDLKTHERYHQTRVTISIDKKYNNIPDSVNVKLMTRGLGSSYIELVVPQETLDPNLPTARFLVDEYQLQGSTGVASEFFPPESQRKLEELVNEIGALIKNANEILGDKKNKQNLKNSLANLSEASKKATGALEEFQRFSIEAANTSEQLSKTVAELRVILSKVNSGEGTAAKLVNDGRLYENLLESTEQLHMLIKEMKLFVQKSQETVVPIRLK